MTKFNHAFSIQFFVLFFALMVPAISAQTFEVSRTDDPAPDGCNSGADCSLREAIIAANGVGSGTATIQLVGGQTYTLSIVNPTPEDDFDSPDEATGSLKILNTDATIRIEAAGSGMATIDADDIDRVFIIYAGTDVEIDEIEITGGNPANGRGGGIFAFNNNNLEITNSSITGNTAINVDHASGFGYGGGIWGEGVTMTITGSTISNNEAGFQGGGIRIIRYNEEVTVNSDVTIENSVISNNDGGQYGGGIFSERAGLTITESSISDNQVTFVGGGIAISLDGDVRIDRSTIDGNTGGLGGGLDIGGGEAFIINSTISGNEAGNFNGAGGIYVGNFSDPVVDIVNTTITNNRAGSIGGIKNGTGGGVINFSNSIVVNQAEGDDCSGTFNSNGYNIESAEDCGFTETGDLQNSDPLLGPLQDNGGTVLTHAISGPLSPAVNNGSNALYTSEGGGDPENDFDANGNARVFDFAGGGIIDIGAFELQQDATFEGCPVTHEDKILFVKKDETGSGANWSDALGELRDALALFDDETCTAEDVEEIWVSAGMYLPTDDSGDREATFLMPGVNIYGGFEGDETHENQRDLESNVSILSGHINDDGDELAGNSYHVVTSLDESSGVLFDFTITGGNANGSDPYDKGGGLYASNGGISMSNVLFENNYAETAGGGAYVIETVERIGAQQPAFFRTTFRNNESGEDGGALTLDNAESRITFVTFENNEAGEDGGGLALDNAEPRITYVTFENNSADRYGGGLFNDQSDPILKNVIFKDNSADSEGGGILNNLSSPELFNVLITGNNAQVNGGGMVNGTNSNPFLTNVTISGNDTEFNNGGGIYNRNGAAPMLLNTIVWGNTANGTGNEIWNSSNSTIELNFSLYGNETGDIVEGDGFTVTNSRTSNPVFSDIGAQDFTLQSTSPAINSGDPNTDLDPFEIIANTPQDLAENPRVFNGDVDIIDIGAYEFQGEPGSSEFTPFITTWEVEAGDLQITIPTAAGQTYSYDVDWGDGENDTGLTGDANHTYGSADTYTVKITGTFPQIEFFNADDRDKILSVEQWGDIEWESMRKAFQGATNLVINATDTPDLSNATSMLEMFSGATFVNGGLENWDVSTITSMFGLFDGATSFNGDISGWDVSAATDMIRMFAGATAFDQDIGSWAVDNVNTTESMFDGATSFNQDLSGWNTGNVSGMSWMFHDASSFNQDLGDWDIADVSSMTEMLDGSGLSQENYDNTLIGWEDGTVMDDVTLGADGLEYCNAVEERDALINDHNWDITGDSENCSFAPFITTWKTDNPGDSDDQSIRIPMIGNGYDFNVDWGDGSDEDYINDPGVGVSHFIEHTYASSGEYEVKISGTFPRIHFNNLGDREKILTIQQWGDIEWSSMNAAFAGASNVTYNATDAPDLSAVTSMGNMFFGAASFNGDLSSWDVSNVNDMSSMFSNATSFNGNVSTWNVSDVTNMGGMFNSASAFNQDISDWNVGNVENMSGMFNLVSAFDQDISGWNVESVTDMRFMFFEALAFDQDISDWDVSNVEQIRGMFSGAENFNQNISNWDVSGIEDMVDMFADASSFNQNLGGWDISSITTMAGMLDGSGLSTENYDNTLIGWESQAVMNDVELGADGLTYCNGEGARQALIDDHNWDITGDALADGCTTPEGEDQRIFVSNASNYEFSKSDFGISNDDFFIKIETLPDEGTLLFEDDPVNLDDKISINDINSGDFTWDMPDGEYGYNFTSFDFTIVDDGDVESEESYTLTIDLGSALVELSGSEGWRFMSNPSDGDSYSGLFSGITVETDAPSSQTLYELDQPAYEWDPVGSTGDEPGVGTPFIIYVLEDDLPETVESGDNWNDLDGSYSFSGLDYHAAEDEPNPDDFYLLGNPHPIALDFCQFVDEDISTSAYFWNPEANGGNGDYLSLNCAAPEDVFIAPFQAFWVRTTDPNPVLEIPEVAYLESSEEGYFKQPSKGSDPSADGLALAFTVQSEDNIFTNTARILFSEQVTTGLDKWDAPKLSAEGLASQWLSFHSLDEDGRTYAFQSLPDSQLRSDKVRIPLDIQTTEAGSYTMEWSLPEPDQFAGSYFLRDNRTGQVMELREGAEYRFEITEIEKTKDTPLAPLDRGEFPAKTQGAVEPRFELLIAQAGVDGFTELDAVPEAFELAQNYPNPFNPTTVINYQLPVTSEVRLDVYDMLGRQVATLVNEQVAAGRHTVNFDASGLSSGVYLYRLVAGSSVMTRKLTVVK